MKLKSRRNNKLPIIIVIVAVVVLLLVIVGVVILLSNQEEQHNPQDIESISLKSTPSKVIYYVGEEFDPIGISVRIGTYDLAYSYVVDHNSLTFSGFDSSVPVVEQVITVSYKGFTTTFTVTIKEIPKDTATVESFEIFDFKTTITMSDWNEYGPISLIRGSTLKLIISDGSFSDPVYIDPSWVWGYQEVTQPGTFDLTIKYNNDGTLYEKVVTITITN